MAFSSTTTGRGAFAGVTNYRKSNPAVGHDSLVNPTPPTLPAAGVAAALAAKLNGTKAKARAAIRRLTKACFSVRWDSAAWSTRWLAILQLVQLVTMGGLLIQLGCFSWRASQHAKEQERAAQHWEQTKQRWELEDQLDAYEEAASLREQWQDLRIEKLEERIERLELHSLDNSCSPSPQRSSSTIVGF